MNINPALKWNIFEKTYSLYNDQSLGHEIGTIYCNPTNSFLSFYFKGKEKRVMSQSYQVIHWKKQKEPIINYCLPFIYSCFTFTYVLSRHGLRLLLNFALQLLMLGLLKVELTRIWGVVNCSCSQSSLHKNKSTYTH